MKKTLLALAPIFAAGSLFAAPALAALPVGATAPEFSTEATMAGNAYPYDLDKELKKGPVVLYFFPAAFTPGCTVEAHEFAEATDQYHALGATVIGVTNGHVDRLKEFSVSECRSKFPVAADPDLKIAKSYESTLAMMPGLSDRTSYVITPDHKVLAVYSAMNPDKHVSTTMDALKAWRASHPQ